MTAERAPADRLFVAIDVEALAAAEVLLDRLQGVARGCKIGSQLFTAAGPAAIEAAHKRGYRVFLDLKFHDIPNTVAGAVREATRQGVFMLNVHASGGREMMRAAAQAATAAAADFAVTRPVCLGVTVLTSLERRELQEQGLASSVDAHVLRLATLAREAGLDGSVASPREVGLLRGALGGHWIIVTPGIRGMGSSDAQTRVGSSDDQKRIATAAAAVAAGADYIVVGRPITAAADPAVAARLLVDELTAGV